MKRIMLLVSLLLVPALVGCGGGEDKPTPALPDSGAPGMQPDMQPGSSTPDGGAGDARPSIPLTDWVHAMVKEGQDDGNGPADTVADKVGIVEDTDDPAAFNEFVMPAP
jgi:hypothetical protein